MNKRVVRRNFCRTGLWPGHTADGSRHYQAGVAGAHSGDLASYGLPSVNAAKLVVESRSTPAAASTGKWLNC